MNRCKVCGAKTNNPTWCSNDCVDISEGNSPRHPPGFVGGAESPDAVKDPGGDKFESHDRLPGSR